MTSKFYKRNHNPSVFLSQALSHNRPRCGLPIPEIDQNSSKLQEDIYIASGWWISGFAANFRNRGRLRGLLYKVVCCRWHFLFVTYLLAYLWAHQDLMRRWRWLHVGQEGTTLLQMLGYQLNVWRSSGERLVESCSKRFYMQVTKKNTINTCNTHLMTSLMLFMDAAIVLRSRNILATEESWSSPWRFFDDWNSSILSRFLVTVEDVFRNSVL